MFDFSPSEPGSSYELLPASDDLLGEVVDEVQGLSDETAPLCTYDDPVYVGREQFVYVEPAHEGILPAEVVLGEQRLIDDLAALKAQALYDAIMVNEGENTAVWGSVEELLLEADAGNNFLPAVRMVERRLRLADTGREPLRQDISVAYYSAHEADEAAAGGASAAVPFNILTRATYQGALATGEVKEWIQRLREKRRELQEPPDAGA